MKPKIHIRLSRLIGFDRLVAELREQKGQRTPAMQIARAAGPKLFLSFSPSKERFAFPRRPQITREPFSMMGEACYYAKTIKPKNSVKQI